MKLVVDTNVLFTFFWKNSVFKNISEKAVELYSPEYALEEINRYESEIRDKTSISREEFKKLKQKVALTVDFIPLETYAASFRETLSLAREYSNKECEEIIKDIDFFALALYLHIPLWSNDALLKKQSKILVFTTREIIDLFDK